MPEDKFSQSRHLSEQHSSRLKSFKELFVEKMHELWGIDVRALAIFRIFIAIIILCDLFVRSQDLVAHYTDEGLLPRKAIFDHPGLFNGSIARFFPHFYGGGIWWEAFLFALAAFFAFLLLIGFKTRIVSIVSWILLASIIQRNTFVVHSGDVLMRVLLFWGLFLPLGARFSVDALLNNARISLKKNILSLATVGLLLQVCIVYWMSAAYKHNPEWLSGKAVYYALNIDQFTTEYGHWLAQQTPLLPYLTWMVLYTESFGPCFAFIPFFTTFFRTLTSFAFITMHFCFGFFMVLGIFPYVPIAGWLLFLPRTFWDKVFPASKKNTQANFTIYYHNQKKHIYTKLMVLRGILGLSDKCLHEMEGGSDNQLSSSGTWYVLDKYSNKFWDDDALNYLLKNVTSPILKVYLIGGFLRWILARMMKMNRLGTYLLEARPIYTQLSWKGNLVAGFFLCVMIGFNLSTLSFFPKKTILFSSLYKVALLAQLEQNWNMFTMPLKDDGWYVIVGTLLNEEEIDLFHDGKPVTWEKPLLVSKTFKNKRWIKYMQHIWWKKYASLRPYYAQYLCRQWNAEHKGLEKLYVLKIYFMLEETNLNEKIEPIEKVLLWTHYCYQNKPLEKNQKLEEEHGSEEKEEFNPLL